VANSGPGPKPPPPEADALVRAYLEKRGNLIRFLAARTRSQAAAEDLAQELYLKIAARPDGAEADNPTALLYRIALNLMLDRARGEARAAARDAEWRAAHRTLVAGEELAQDAPPDEAAASRQRLAQLIAAAAALPPQMRRAFTLHKLEGLSHAETARAMGISVKSVEKHVSAALKALTARLAP
jgi:RNA polymerase sigma-70 factor (ECF subfamily)